VKRREFITLLGGAAAWPLAARAQQSERMQRIGVLMGAAADDPRVKAQLAGLREGLARLGWVEGRTLQTDYGFAASTSHATCFSEATGAAARRTARKER
jgi:putative ABC transport system substrate-binding protein